MELSKFKPSISYLQGLKKNYQDVEIINETDSIGYDMVKTGIKELGEARRKVKTTGKDMRAEAVRIQKQVIALEKEALEIIVPLEKDLQEKKLKIDNLANLEEWQNKLKDVNAEIEDSVLLKMTTREFNKYYQGRRDDFLEAQAKKERERIEKEEQKKREKEIAENAKKEAEQKAQWEKEERERKLETKKEEEKIKQEQKEKREQEKLEDKKVQDFLKKNNWDRNTDIVQNNGEEIKLYRIVNTLKV